MIEKNINEANHAHSLNLIRLYLVVAKKQSDFVLSYDDASISYRDFLYLAVNELSEYMRKSGVSCINTYQIKNEVSFEEAFNLYKLLSSLTLNLYDNKADSMLFSIKEEENSYSLLVMSNIYLKDWAKEFDVFSDEDFTRYESRIHKEEKR